MSSKDKETAEEQMLNEGTEAQSETEMVEEPIVADEKDILIAQLEQQLSDAAAREKDLMLRAKAEEENIRRRAELDVEKAHKFGIEKFATELLPVIDNLERALEQCNKEDKAMVEGIELTLKSFVAVVKKFGMEVIDQVNVPFDPQNHEALTVIPSPNHESNMVIDMMQKGYTLNGRLIRPARVVVSK